MAKFRFKHPRLGNADWFPYDSVKLHAEKITEQPITWILKMTGNDGMVQEMVFTDTEIEELFMAFQMIQPVAEGINKLPRAAPGMQAPAPGAVPGEWVCPVEQGMTGVQLLTDTRTDQQIWDAHKMEQVKVTAPDGFEVFGIYKYKCSNCGFTLVSHKPLNIK